MIMQTIHIKLSPLKANKYESIVQAFGNEELLIDKFIEFHVQKLQKEILVIESDLQTFEKKYATSSSDFYVKFENGECGDSKDFILWSGLFEMQLLCKQKLDKLL
jgi:hypothetical protein